MIGGLSSRVPEPAGTTADTLTLGKKGNGGLALRTTDMKDTRASIDVGGVLHTGRELDVHDVVTLPEFAAFRFPSSAHVALRVRRVGRGIELKGTIDAVAEGECARCLDDVRLPLHLDVDERFDPGSERDDPLGETNVLVGDVLDLQDLTRQSIDSALPMALLCEENCGGLCAECGLKRDGSCTCPHPEK